MNISPATFVGMVIFAQLCRGNLFSPCFSQDSVSILANDFAVSSEAAVVVKNKARPRVKMNVFQENQCGVFVAGYSHAQVTDNTFTDNAMAVNVDGWSGIQFLRNSVSFPNVDDGLGLIADPDPKGFIDPSRPEIERDDEEERTQASRQPLSSETLPEIEENIEENEVENDA